MTIITESSIFAVMSRVNKVFIDCESVLKDGGVITKNNGLLLATAAQHFKVPFIVFSPIYTLTLSYAYD